MTDSDDVLLAKTASLSETMPSISFQNSRFAPRFSVIASMTRSQSAKSPLSVVG
jgi:hypothetical protein